MADKLSGAFSTSRTPPDEDRIREMLENAGQIIKDRIYETPDKKKPKGRNNLGSPTAIAGERG